MAAKKFYAVKSGREPGIYTVWKDCQRQVTGYKGAQFKGFMTLEEAQQYMGGADSGASYEPRDGAVIAYVDGSYNIRTKAFSYGAVIFDGGSEITMSEAFEDEELASMRNVAGEINGSMAAMRYCVEHGKHMLDLYYDYEGISKWCTGEWKTNKKGTVAYKEYYDSVKDRLDVRFVKVKGHSGDKYNDMADRLAKDAVGIE